MLRSVRDWLERLPIEDPVKRRHATLVQVAAGAGLAWVVTALSVGALRGTLTTPALIALVVGGAGAVACVALVRGGRLELGLHLPTWAMVLDLGLLVGRGLSQGAPYHRLMPVPLVASALLGGAGAVWSVFAALVAILGAGALRDAGYLGGVGPLPPEPPPLGALGGPIAGLFVIAVVVDRMSAVLREALASARQREAEARASHDRATMAFETTPDAVNVTRLSDGVYLEVNPGFTRMSGYAPGEALGRTSADLDLWVDPQVREELLRRQRGGAAIHNVEARFRRKDGSVIVGLISSRPVTYGGVPCVLTITRDVTDLRRAEDEKAALAEQLRQSQKLESVGQLAGGVAHDFNNHLTVILACAEGLEEAAARGEPASEEDTREILEAAGRARAITRQLLAFARKQEVAPVPLDLGAALRATEPMLRRVVGEGVEVTLAVEGGLWPVRADPSQVDQILMNLAANARDALPRGGHLAVLAANVVVDGAGAWPGAGPGPFVHLTVRDDGEGMAPEVKARAFDPFYTTKEVGHGTGLGLATVHGIVTQMGGQIRLESAPGAGTAVEMIFPRCAEAALPAPAREEAPGGGRGELVLLVEDEAPVRTQAVRVLTGAGYRVIATADGEEAVEVAETLASPPDLVLTDVILPRLDGGRVAELLRARWPGVPILFTSGYTADRLASHGVGDAPREVLEKPFTRAGLLGRVRATLDRRDG